MQHIRLPFRFKMLPLVITVDADDNSLGLGIVPSGTTPFARKVVEPAFAVSSRLNVIAEETTQFTTMSRAKIGADERPLLRVGMTYTRVWRFGAFTLKFTVAIGAPTRAYSSYFLRYTVSLRDNMTDFVVYESAFTEDDVQYKMYVPLEKSTLRIWDANTLRRMSEHFGGLVDLDLPREENAAEVDPAVLKSIAAEMPTIAIEKIEEQLREINNGKTNDELLENSLKCTIDDPEKLFLRKHREDKDETTNQEDTP